MGILYVWQQYDEEQDNWETLKQKEDETTVSEIASDLYNWTTRTKEQMLENGRPS